MTARSSAPTTPISIAARCGSRRRQTSNPSCASSRAIAKATARPGKTTRCTIAARSISPSTIRAMPSRDWEQAILEANWRRALRRRHHHQHLRLARLKCRPAAISTRPPALVSTPRGQPARPDGATNFAMPARSALSTSPPASIVRTGPALYRRAAISRRASAALAAARVTFIDGAAFANVDWHLSDTMTLNPAFATRRKTSSAASRRVHPRLDRRSRRAGRARAGRVPWSAATSTTAR